MHFVTLFISSQIHQATKLDYIWSLLDIRSLFEPASIPDEVNEGEEQPRPSEEGMDEDRMDEDSEVVEVMRPAENMPLTESCHHYNKLAKVPWDLQK